MSTEPAADRRMRMALCRYQVISAYVALTPPRGGRRKMLEQLAAKSWPGPDGEPLSTQPETLRVWIRRYRRAGLNGLMDKEREHPGVAVLNADLCELVCKLKRDVPERSLEQIIAIAQDTNLAEPGTLRRSTVHRVLQSQGLSARKPPTGPKDLDRFEAERPNDLWQSDMLAGPWLPDPARPGKLRRAFLYAFIDDHSRLLLHGRFSFREDLPTLELVLRRAVQRWGIPRRLYYDNGQVYRAHHMHQIVASLGSHRVVYTRRYRPEGHGKIEAFNRMLRGQFLSELKASNIRTIDELNEAFIAFIEQVYHQRIHSQTGQSPLERWRCGAQRIRYADEEVLRQAFLWKEERTPDKCGVLSLLGIRFQVGPALARRKLQVRFDPEVMHEVEIWHRGKFAQRARPLQIGPHRRPSPQPQEPMAPSQTTPAVDWLGTLVSRSRKHAAETPTLQPLTVAQRRALADQNLLSILAAKLAPGSLDEPWAHDFLSRFGPFDPVSAEQVLDTLLSSGAPLDQHVSFYLEHIKNTLRSDLP